MPRKQVFHSDSESDEFETPALRNDDDPNTKPTDSDDAEVIKGKNAEELYDDSDDDDVVAPKKGGRVVKGLYHDDDDNDSNDSDSSMEDIPRQSWNEASQTVKANLQKQLQDDMNEKKEKRRKKEELFRQQKAEKLKELRKRKLAEEDLEGLNTLCKKKEKKVKTEKKKCSPEQEEEKDECYSSHGEGEEEDKEVEENLEFISLVGGSTSQLVAQKDGHPLHVPLSQSVVNFKHDMLFGARHHRISNEKRKQLQAKRQVMRR